MGSSEIVDSGRFSGGRSSFSQTCSLLSQYLKENGSFGDLSLGFTPKLGAPTETMNFLPMIEKSRDTTPFSSPPPPPAAPGKDETQKKSDLSTVAKPEAETAQMTIFYAGKVIVLDDFPAEKAKEIMMLASRSSAAQNHPSVASPPPRKAQIPAASATQIPNIVPTFGIQPPIDSDLPIARKNSLTRFLEKRRDRITENAPYPKSKPAAPSSTAANPEAWLGLARQLPLQVQRH
ncbi:hypothetical protein ACP275_10G063800 [Erythranthe tilingii]